MKEYFKKVLKRVGLFGVARAISTAVSPKREVRHRNNKPNESLFKKHLKSTFGDQKGQVEFLINNVLDYENSGLKRNGYFIDLAAADGITGSNTFFLERYLGWDGLLFEPNPNFKSIVEANRTSKLIVKCVTDRLDETVRFRIDNGPLGGIVSDNTDNNQKIRGDELEFAEIIEVPTTSLAKELDDASAPTLIDFLSLDVEGAEWLVLKDFPFDRYKFHCIAIERPNTDLDLLLDENGYRQVKHMNFDVVYVHSDFVSEMNLNPRFKFAFTPTKDW